MEIVPTNMTVADYCEAMERNEIQVNRHYQRSDKVWPTAARSFLIETILLGYPMPKLSLYQRTDVKSRKVYKEIVDGQQRSTTILDFYQGKYKLASTLDGDGLAACKYSDLQEPLQEKFLSYPLGIDLFVVSTPEDIREVFRRINSYNVPLNPEEQRHATYQGLFKWFIHRLTRKHDKHFGEMGILSTKQIVRMADAKILTELCHSLLKGIETTKRPQLDALYRERDDQFPQERELQSRITSSIERLAEWKELHGGPLMKAYVAYSLLLAISHIERQVDALETHFPSPGVGRIAGDHVVPNLLRLGEILLSDDPPPRNFQPFFTACSGRTNVRDQRVTRFRWFCQALTEARL